MMKFSDINSKDYKFYAKLCGTCMKMAEDWYKFLLCVECATMFAQLEKIPRHQPRIHAVLCHF